MQLQAVDALGVQQIVLVSGVESPVDHSGAISSTGSPQTIIQANSLRSGFFIQNRGANPMYLNELGVASTGSGSLLIAPGGYFPVYGYPVSSGALSLVGTAGDIFTAREW